MLEFRQNNAQNADVAVYVYSLSLPTYALKNQELRNYLFLFVCAIYKLVILPLLSYLFFTGAHTLMNCKKVENDKTWT